MPAAVSGLPLSRLKQPKYVSNRPATGSTEGPKHSPVPSRRKGTTVDAKGKQGTPDKSTEATSRKPLNYKNIKSRIDCRRRATAANNNNNNNNYDNSSISENSTKEHKVQSPLSKEHKVQSPLSKKRVSAKKIDKVDKNCNDAKNCNYALPRLSGVPKVKNKRESLHSSTNKSVLNTVNPPDNVDSYEDNKQSNTQRWVDLSIALTPKTGSLKRSYSSEHISSIRKVRGHMTENAVKPRRKSVGDNNVLNTDPLIGRTTVMSFGSTKSRPSEPCDRVQTLPPKNIINRDNLRTKSEIRPKSTSSQNRKSLPRPTDLKPSIPQVRKLYLKQMTGPPANKTLGGLTAPMRSRLTSDKSSPDNSKVLSKELQLKEQQTLQEMETLKLQLSKAKMENESLKLAHSESIQELTDQVKYIESERTCLSEVYVITRRECVNALGKVTLLTEEASNLKAELERSKSLSVAMMVLLLSFHWKSESDLKHWQKLLIKEQLTAKEMVKSEIATWQAKLSEAENSHAVAYSEIQQQMKDKEASLQAELEDEKTKLHNLQEETTAIQEEFDEEVKKRVDVAAAPYKHLQDDVNSLTAVLDIKTQEIHSFRDKNTRLKDEVDRLRAEVERISQMEQEIENLRAVVSAKAASELELNERCRTLSHRYDKESRTNKRLSQNCEELQFRLSTSMTSSSGPEDLSPFSPNTVFRNSLD